MDTWRGQTAVFDTQNNRKVQRRVLLVIASKKQSSKLFTLIAIDLKRKIDIQYTRMRRSRKNTNLFLYVRTIIFSDIDCAWFSLTLPCILYIMVIMKMSIDIQYLKSHNSIWETDFILIVAVAVLFIFIVFTKLYL